MAHPAKGMWLGVLACLLLALAFVVAACVVPRWSRIDSAAGILDMQDYLSPYISNSSVSDESILYMGLWQWCLNYGDAQFSYVCANTRGNSVPAFADPKCQGHFYASRHLSWICAVFIVLALILAFLVFSKVSKWSPGAFFKPPTVPALLAFLLILLALGLCLAAWICWIVLSEHHCRPNATVWNPFQGYSTSFIFMCVATFFLICAMLLACLGLMKLKKAPAHAAVPKEEVVYVEDPMPQSYPVTYPMEATYPVTQTMMPTSYTTAPVSYPVPTY